MIKKLLIIATVISWPYVASASDSAKCGPPDPMTLSHIESLHQRDSEASKRSDASARAAILALLTDDVVMIAPGAPPVVGKAAWAKVLEQTDASATDWMIDSYTEEYPEIVVCGDLAYERGSITTVAHNQKTGRKATQVGNSLRILRRTQYGEWLIHTAMFNAQSAE
jgi:ketosteroid isomerase-like protein